MNYTEGKWEIHTDNEVYFYYVNTDEYPVMVTITPTSDGNGLANANLIAASPDMYEALKELMERFNKGIRYPLQTTCDKANEALLKAEGK